MDIVKKQSLAENQNRLQVRLENNDFIIFQYQPKTDHALYDVCDLNGRIMLTGEIINDHTRVEISDLYPDQYILLVLDGDKVCSTKFALEDY